MRSEYESEVIDTLENTFGWLNSKDDIEQAIISAADNAVEDNTPDYISDLIRTVDDSFLEGLGEDAVDVMYRQLVKNSDRKRHWLCDKRYCRNGAYRGFQNGYCAVAAKSHNCRKSGYGIY